MCLNCRDFRACLKLRDQLQLKDSSNCASMHFSAFSHKRQCLRASGLCSMRGRASLARFELAFTHVARILE
eukprot:6095307-Pleurochrysis_carterae.AAC.4